MSATIHNKPKLPRFLSLLLVVILGILAAKLMWLIITPNSTSIEQVQTVQNISLESKEKIDYGKLIANQHIFGIVEVKKAPIVEAPKTAKEPAVIPTKLNLTLHGIVAYKSNNGGYALISASGSTQKVYGKGDTIQEGVVVSTIFADKVILDNNGKSEELLLPSKSQNSLSGQTSNNSILANLPGARDRKPSLNNLNIANNIDLGNLRKDIVANPQKLLEIATPSPAIVNGKFLGFRVRPGRKRQEFRKLGLRYNDIITEVNGIILDDYSKGVMLTGELQQASDLTISVKRGSRNITLPTIQF